MSAVEYIAGTQGTGTSEVISFNSIPGNYTDLILQVTCQLVTGTGYFMLGANNDGGSIFSTTWLSGNGSAASSGRTTNTGSTLWTTGTSFPVSSSQPTVVTAHYMNYTSTSMFKTTLVTIGAPYSHASASVGLYRSTSALNAIAVSTGAGGVFWSTSTVATLWGVK